MKRASEYCYAGVNMSDPVNQWQKAIETRNIDEVARLLDQHPEFANTKIMDRKRDGTLNTDGHHQEALDHVGRTGHVEIAKLLVQAGANEKRIQGAFMLAHPDVAKYLMRYCDDPKPNIDLMAYIGKWESLEFWFSQGFKPEKYALHNASSGRPSMRHFAARDDSQGDWKERFRETVRVLLDAGADPNERHRSGNVKWEGAKPWRNNGESPLHHAAASHDIVLINQLIEAGADKTLKNDLGDTPCCWAIRYNAPAEAIRQLDFQGNSRRSPELWKACHDGDLDKVKGMLDAGADPNAYNEDGAGTLLNFHPEITLHLLAKGANPDLQRNENILPVLVGVAGFNTNCLKAMLDAGADPNIESHVNGEKALHHAVCGNNIEQIEALLNAGADPYRRTIAGKPTYMFWRDVRCRNETPLHRAAAYGTFEVVQILLDHGADPMKRDANGDSPLSWASWHMRDKQIIDLLENAMSDRQ